MQTHNQIIKPLHHRLPKTNAPAFRKNQPISCNVFPSYDQNPALSKIIEGAIEGRFIHSGGAFTTM